MAASRVPSRGHDPSRFKNGFIIGIFPNVAFTPERQGMFQGLANGCDGGNTLETGNIGNYR
jgi:hypothetical protein